jgi:CDP-2,3-bis-(O-geranylgeranyl)-sn-glycerol synthase
MFSTLHQFFYLITLASPAFLANMLPIIATKYNWFPLLAKPISESFLGANKTWRGLLCGTLAAILLSSMLHLLVPRTPFHTLESALTYGLLAGAGALLGDIFKSLIKRRVGIKSGQPFVPFDQIDYILGMILATSPVFAWQFWDIVILLGFALIFNPLTNLLAYLFKIKKTFW